MATNLPAYARLSSLLLAVLSISGQAAGVCKGTLYLTFDTGSQSQADFVARTLKKHGIKATFFMANEKTVDGDYSLDPSWGPFWKARVAEGHAFGTHTFDHVYAQRDLPDGRIEVKPQFGQDAGKKLAWTPPQYCDELKRVSERFQALTGAKLNPFWRAPDTTLARGRCSVWLCSCRLGRGRFFW